MKSDETYHKQLSFFDFDFALHGRKTSFYDKLKGPIPSLKKLRKEREPKSYNL